jgi:Rad3-related DNA helicase
MPVKLRPWQEEVLNSIHDADENTTIAINAPTGSGKTLLSLLLADKLGADVIIAGMRTKTEQRRFWEDIRKFGIPFYPLVFFAKNDQCLMGHNEDKDPLEEIEDETEILCNNCKYTSTPKATAIFEKIKDYEQNGTENDDEPNDLIEDLREVVVDYLDEMNNIDIFPGTNIESYRKLLAGRLKIDNICTYALTKNLSYYAVFTRVPISLIGTYPYIFSFPSVLFKRLYKLPELSDNDEARFVIIIDEAHNLDDLDFLEYRISSKRLERIIKYINDACTGGEMVSECNAVNIEKLKEIAKRFGERLNELAKQYGLLDKKNVGVTHKRLCGKDTCEAKIMEEILGMLDEFAKIIAPFVEYEKAIRKKIVTPFVRTVYIAKTLFEYLQGRPIHTDELPDWMAIPDVWYFYLTAEDNISLSIKPISPKPIIMKARKVFRGPWIIMSGTLYNKEYIERVWGLEITHYFDFTKKVVIGRMDVKIIEEVTSRFEERNAEMYQKYAKKIEEIVTNNDNGVYLVVYPNFRMMNEIADRLRHLPNDQVKQLRETQVRDTGEILNLALTSEKLILHAVAKGRFTEGIELTHNNKSLIKHVIVAGVPFPNIRDDYVQDRIRASGYGEREWLEEHARITTLQAIGRAIRFPDDSVTVWLLDKRFKYYAIRWGIKPRLRITY